MNEICWFFILSLFQFSDAVIPEQVHIAFYSSPWDISVSWITFEPADPVLSFGKSENDLEIVWGNTTSWDFEGITRYSHNVILEHLEPSQRYVYLIENRKFSFKTMPSDLKTYKVCIFGDLGIENGVSMESILRNGLAEKFDFIIHLGDIAYNLHSNHGKTGDEFMNLIEPIASKIPYMVIAGNHENDRQNFSNFKNRFVMPKNGGDDNQFYSLDIGPIHWVGLSTEYYGFHSIYATSSIFTQHNWLIDDLRKANSNRENVPWIVVYQHRPFYCSGEMSNNCTLTEHQNIRKGTEDFPGLEEDFIKNSVDIGFAGHMHAYERTWPVADHLFDSRVDAYTNPLAPFYIVTGSAGCHTPGMKFSEIPTQWSAFRSEEYGYTILTIENKSTIHIEQLSTGQQEEKVIDEVWVKKNARENLIDMKSERIEMNMFF